MRSLAYDVIISKDVREIIMNRDHNLKYSLEYYNFNVHCGYNYILFILSAL